MIRHAACAGVLLGLLSGCATVSPPPAATTATQVRAYHPAIDIGGRLSVRYQNGANEEAVHGSFTWSQAPAHTHIALLSPLGQTIAAIEVAPGGATLHQAGAPLRSAADADALAAATLGWPMPVAGLRDWLQGFAVDAQGQAWVAQPGVATDVTTRDGWHIRYPVWQNAAPRRIDLTRHTAEAGTVAMRIVIDNWQPK